jgi:hypothetical protein
MKAAARCRAGHSLVEMLLATTLLTFLVGGAASLLGTSAGLFEEASAISTHDQATSRAMQRVVRLLVDAGVSTLQPAELTTEMGASSLVFRASTGFAEGELQWGELQRLALEEDPRDPANGVDDDGDGVVDERRLTWTRDVGGMSERSVTLCADVAVLFEGEEDNGVDDNGNGVVDEAGFGARLDGRRLWIGLTRASSSSRGNALFHTEAVTLRLRNGLP